MHSFVERVFCMYLFMLSSGWFWVGLDNRWMSVRDGGIQRRTEVCLLSDLVYCIYPQLLCLNSVRETVLPGRWGLKQCCLLLKRSVRKENRLEENGGEAWVVCVKKQARDSSLPFTNNTIRYFWLWSISTLPLSGLSKWHQATHPLLYFILSAVPSSSSSTVLANQRW